MINIISPEDLFLNQYFMLGYYACAMISFSLILRHCVEKFRVITALDLFLIIVVALWPFMNMLVVFMALVFIFLKFLSRITIIRKE